MATSPIGCSHWRRRGQTWCTYFQPIVLYQLCEQSLELWRRQDRPFPGSLGSQAVEECLGLHNRVHQALYKPFALETWGSAFVPIESVFFNYCYIDTNLAKHTGCECVMGIEWSSTLSYGRPLPPKITFTIKQSYLQINQFNFIFN